MMNEMLLESARTTLNSSDSVIISRTEIDSSATLTNSGHDGSCSDVSSFVIEENECDDDSTLVFQELSSEDVHTGIELNSLDMTAHRSHSAVLEFSATRDMDVADDDYLISSGSPTSTTSNYGSPGNVLNVDRELPPCEIVSVRPLHHSTQRVLDFSATHMDAADDDYIISSGSPPTTTSIYGSYVDHESPPLQGIPQYEIDLPASGPLHHSTPKANPLNRQRRQKSRIPRSMRWRQQKERMGIEVSTSQISPPEDEGELSVSAASKLTQKCCKRSCVDTLSDGEIERARHRFMSKSTTEQNQFLIDSFQISNCNDSSQSSNGDPDGMIEGRRLCCTAFTGALGISKKRYKNLYEQFKKGVVKFERKPMQKYESTKVSEAKAWMARYFNTIGDHMPHVQQTHLPHFLTKRDIYERMVLELTKEGIPKNKVISQSHFYGIWESCFKHVVIPEVTAYD